MPEWIYFLLVPVGVAIAPFTYKGAREFLADRRFLAGVSASPGIKAIPPAGERLSAVESDVTDVKRTVGEHTVKLDYIVGELSRNSGKSTRDLVEKIAIRQGVLPDPQDATADDLPKP